MDNGKGHRSKGERVVTDHAERHESESVNDEVRNEKVGTSVLRAGEVQDSEAVGAKAKQSILDKFRERRAARKAERERRLVEECALEVMKICANDQISVERRLALIEKGVQRGRYKMSDSRIADGYMGIVPEMSGFYIARMESVGLEQEQIAQNDHMQDLAIDMLKRGLNDSVRGSDMSLGDVVDSINTSGSDVALRTLDAALQHEDKAKRATEGLQVQQLGEELLERYGKYGVLRDGIRTDTDSERIQRDLALMRRLGYEPFKNNRDFDNVLKNVGLQRMAAREGLLSTQTVDRMYGRKLELLTEHGRNDENMSMAPSMTILPELETTGENPVVEHWRRVDAEAVAGEGDPMTMTVSVVQREARNRTRSLEEERSAAEVFDSYFRDGALQDAFFESSDSMYNAPMHTLRYSFHESEHSKTLRYDEGLMAVMAQNLDRLQGWDRGFVETWKKLGDGLDDEDAQKARESFMRFATGGHNMYDYAMFDENGITEDFLEQSMRYPDFAIDFAHSLEGRYTEKELRLFEMAKKYAREINIGLLVRDGKQREQTLRETVDGFFDENLMPTEALANAALAKDTLATIGMPEIAGALTGAGKQFYNFCASLEKSSSLRSKSEEIYSPDSKELSRGCLKVKDVAAVVSSFGIDGCFDENGPRPPLAYMLFRSKGASVRFAMEGHPELVEMLDEKERTLMHYYASQQTSDDERALIRGVVGGTQAEQFSAWIDKDGWTDEGLELALSKKWDLVEKIPALVERLSDDQRKYLAFCKENESMAKVLKWIADSTDQPTTRYFDAEKGGIAPGLMIGMLGGAPWTKGLMDGPIADLVKAMDMGQLNESNIELGLARFMYMDADDWAGATPTDSLIREQFLNGETKDLAMRVLQRRYHEMLKNPSGDNSELMSMAEVMRQNDGAGPLVQIESFLRFTGALAPHAERLSDITKKLEERFERDGWSEQEKSNYYAVAAEVLTASPDLYEEFAELFGNIPDSNKEAFRTFTTDIFPLYRAKLTLLKGRLSENDNGLGGGRAVDDYSAVNMQALKNDLHLALSPFNMVNLQEMNPEKWQTGIERVRERIFGEISELFGSRFGILPEVVPPTFEKRDSRAIEDMTLYLSNLHNPTPEKEAMIGFYLALLLDRREDGWLKLRSGEEINASDYLKPEKAAIVQAQIEQSRANNPISSQITGIIDERLESFRRSVQDEVANVRTGNIQTIDLRLQDLSGNLEDLTDPDLYDDPLEKGKIEILHRCMRAGNLDLTGVAASLLWGEASGRSVSPKTQKKYDAMNDDEKAAVTQVCEMMRTLMADNDIEMTPDNINAQLQRGFSALKVPFTILERMKEESVAERIGELQSKLMPPEEIAAIFGRLGEEFRPQSGVLALGADVSYLEDLLVKHEDDLSETERTQAKEYLDGIRGRLQGLQEIFDDTVARFEKMRRSVEGDAKNGQTTQAALLQKIREIDGVIRSSGQQAVITTTCTTSLPIIVENMRQCLSCKTKGCNNDTDLTFGEGYKFYLYSHNDSRVDGSVSDEIVHLVPMTSDDGRQYLSFVMDLVYGRKNSDILMSHIDTMMKKAQVLRRDFPEVPFSVFIPSLTAGSCSTSLSAESLAQNLAEFGIDSRQIRQVDRATVTQPASGYGDHYVEYSGSGARRAGSREIAGFEIIF